MENRIRKIIEKGEGLSIEFKECQYALTAEVYETMCAFLNCNGGEILLGVKNNGTIDGVLPQCVEQIKKDFVSGINNVTKINPPVYLEIKEILLDNKVIIYIYVPASSQVHRCNNKIYLRNNDSDLDITNNNTLVSKVFLKKQTSYSENKIYPHIKIDDLRTDLISRARRLAKNQRANHPWAEMDDFEMLKSAQLYQKNYDTGEEGFTLSAVLLLGKDEVLLSVLPHFKTDVLERIENVVRYDDRDCIQTNLMESYDRIMNFIQKHLPDKFYMENGQRINIRDLIFREIAVNTLIHREFLNPFPAKIVIEVDKIIAENSNKPHIHGRINPMCFHPFPKNPTIAKFFREIGWAEELGSGVKNLFKYSKGYTGFDPVISDSDVFSLILPINLSHQGKLFGFDSVFTDKDSDKDKASQISLFGYSDKDSDKDNDKDIKLNDGEELISDFCQEPKTLIEIMEYLRYKNKPHFLVKILKPMIEKGIIERTIPEKPTSKHQKYISCLNNLMD